MTHQIFALKERAEAAEISLCDDLIDDPDCLAELEYVYSVFRLRHTWGTVYELTFSSNADAHDRHVCFRLMPAAHVFLETVSTDTLGVLDGSEVTHRYITAD